MLGMSEKKEGIAVGRVAAGVWRASISAGLAATRTAAPAKAARMFLVYIFGRSRWFSLGFGKKVQSQGTIRSRVSVIFLSFQGESRIKSIGTKGEM